MKSTCSISAAWQLGRCCMLQLQSNAKLLASPCVSQAFGLSLTCTQVTGHTDPLPVPHRVSLYLTTCVAREASWTSEAQAGRPHQNSGETEGPSPSRGATVAEGSLIHLSLILKLPNWDPLQQYRKCSDCYANHLPMVPKGNKDG